MRREGSYVVDDDDGLVGRAPIFFPSFFPFFRFIPFPPLAAVKKFQVAARASEHEKKKEKEKDGQGERVRRRKRERQERGREVSCRGARKRVLEDRSPSCHEYSHAQHLDANRGYQYYYYWYRLTLPSRREPSIFRPADCNFELQSRF